MWYSIGHKSKTGNVPNLIHNTSLTKGESKKGKKKKKETYSKKLCSVRVKNRITDCIYHQALCPSVGEDNLICPLGGGEI